MIGASNDLLEQEADRVADMVIAGRAARPAGAALSRVQRRASSSDVDNQRAPSSVDRVLAGEGKPLEPELRRDMEESFGYDFSHVRVHTGSAAARSARDVNAQAYTVGHNIVLGEGGLAGTNGRRLIAHELTHVVQQTASATDVRVMRKQVLDSHVEMKRRVLNGQTVFRISQGGLVVTANGNWEPSEEWQGNERPPCPGSTYSVTLNKKSRFLDTSYGSCAFEMGSSVSRQWTNLPEGDYYLSFFLDSSNPNCVFEAVVKASEASGLTGETCTKQPPGPLDILHDALSIAGLVPFLGAVPDAIDAGIYAIQGDWTGAGLSAMAVIPIFGDAASVLRIGERAVVRVEGTVVKKIGTQGIADGLKAAKVVRRALRRPTFKALRATTAIDERLLDVALQHRGLLFQAGEGFASHNIAVVKLTVDGVPTILSAKNSVRELHSEARLISQIDEMVAQKKSVEVLQIYSERIPCTRAGCMQALNAKYPKADIFYSVSEELAESAGSKSRALEIVYGLKP
jgi:hypothetical protein